MPRKAEVVGDSTLYRLVSNNSEVDEPIGFNAHKYAIVGNAKCLAYKVPFSDAVFCASGDVGSGSNGDPFMHALSENGAYPIYQIALDAYHMHDNPTVFLNIHPYIKWITETINGNVAETKNEVIYPVLRGKEITQAQ